MNKYKVVRYDWDEDERSEKVLFFDADSFEFLAASNSIVVIFKNDLDEMVGAVNGFDHVVLDNMHQNLLGIPVVQADPPDTMAA